VSISLTKDTKHVLIPSIRRFFEEKWDEEIGDLKAELLLDFCLREICPAVYNQAIRDAQAFFHEKVADLEGTCYEPEMTYWQVSAETHQDRQEESP